MLPGPVSTALLTSRSTPPQPVEDLVDGPVQGGVVVQVGDQLEAVAPRARTRAAVSSRLPGSGRPWPVSESSRPSPARRVRPVTATSQPCSASATAVALPMPRVAPVTRALAVAPVPVGITGF